MSFEEDFSNNSNFSGSQEQQSPQVSPRENNNNFGSSASFEDNNIPPPHNDDFNSLGSPSHSNSFEPPVESHSSSNFGSSFEETPLSKYRAEHDRYLDDKARKSEEKRDEIINQARQSIDAYYKKRDETKEKTQKTNRTSEKTFVADRDSVLSGTSGSEWSRVSTLIDFKATAIGRDNSRMRKVLIELKH